MAVRQTLGNWMLRTGLGLALGGEARASLENPSVSIGDAEALAKLFGIQPSTSGVNVTHDTALNLAAFWACVSLISGIIGYLPVGVHRRVSELESETARDAPEHKLIATRPNPSTSSIIWRETSQAHVLTWGNTYSRIARTRASGKPTRIIPLRPDRVRQVVKAGERVYEVTLPNGGREDLPPEEVLHVPGLGFDGLTGYSVVNRARNGIGLGMAAEEYGARFFDNDARPSVILKHPGKPDNAAVDNIKKAWIAHHQGVKNAWEPAVTREGIDVETMGFPPGDSQFLETRQFQVADVCRWFGVPPFMVGESAKSTSWGTGLEQQVIGFTSFVLNKWVKRWEQELDYKLFAISEEPGSDELFTKFNLNALLRGDFKTRTAGYQSGIFAGWITRNEVRGLEDLNPLPGLDEPLVPVNMAPADEADDGDDDGDEPGEDQLTEGVEDDETVTA